MRFIYLDEPIDFPENLSEENKALYHGETFYEAPFLEYIRSLRLRGVYIDVGSHIGNHAIYFSRFCLSEKVFSFEPLKTFFDVAQANILKNVPGDKCNIDNYGLSDAPGTATFSFQGVQETIQLKTMDDVLSHIDNACIIKIDVEGSEAAVIKGARNLIKRCKPVVFVEARDEDEFKDVSGILTSMGYVHTDKVFNAARTYEFIHANKGHKQYFEVAEYWNERYEQGGSSGTGSSDRLALFKAQFLNNFVAKNHIASVAELGCGDGAQLGLAEYPNYIGLDVSTTAIEKCKTIFEGDTSKSFFHYQPDNFDPGQFISDLAISLDVIFHLSNDDIYQKYLTHLFSLGRSYVIIYSNNDELYNIGVNERSEYVRFRKCLEDVAVRFPEWGLVDAVPNKYPFNTTLNNISSFADFFVFKKNPPRSEVVSDFDSFSIQKNTNLLATASEQSDLIFKEVQSHRKESAKRHKEYVEQLEKIITNEQKLSQTEQKLHETERRLSEALKEKSELENVRATTEHELHETEQQLSEALKEESELENVRVTTEHKLHETEHRLSKALKQRDTSVQELRSELEEKGQARDRAAVNYLRAKHRLESVSKSFSYQVGYALVQAVAKPGFDTLALPYRLARLFVQGVKERIWPSVNPEAFTALVKLPQGGEVLVPFRINNPRHVQSQKDKITFSLPDGQSAYLTSRENTAFNKPPVNNLVSLAPDTQYMLSGQFEVHGQIQMWLIEYSEYKRLADHKLRIAGNSFQVTFHTHKEHKQVVVAFRIEGGGCLAIPAAPWMIQDVKAAPKPSGWKCTQDILKREASILGWPDTFPDKSKPFIVGIMDEFTTGCFNKDVNLIQPRPDNWLGLAEKFAPVLIFIESAWKGNFGSWQYRVGQYANRPGNEVAQLAAYGRDKNIPVIFWNKEDPVHHDKFMDSARQADLIFTTDANMVASYQKNTGNKKVFPLPFAAQPQLHNPSPLNGRVRKACFAGSWYGGRHAERGEAMQWLLKVARPLGLEIYDRNHGTGIFPFPDEYTDCIKGGLPYEDLCQEYGRYRMFLNVNSVTDSPTMFSRRVFELMACGTPVVSTYSRGIEELLGTDAVWLVQNEAEARHAIETLLTDDQEWRKRSLAGIRQVFAAHTYQHRLHSIFELTGIDCSVPLETSLLLVATAQSTREVDRITEIASSQSWQGFTLLIQYTGGNNPAINMPRNIRFAEKGECTPAGLQEKAKEFNLMGSLVPYADYGPHYLQDLVNAVRYAPWAKAWGKATHEDQFAFNKPVYGDACIHLSGHIGSNPDAFFTPDTIQGEYIYALDTDQFEPGSVNGSIEAP